MLYSTKATLICKVDAKGLPCTTMDKILITEKDAAERYSVSESWLRNRRSESLPPAYLKIGRKVLYDVQSTDKWFRDKEI